MQSLAAVSNKYRLDGVSIDTRPIPKGTQKVKDAGDVPFIFSDELEAATTAKLKAALQSTPASSLFSTMVMNQFSTFTSGTSMNYAATEDACASDFFLIILFFILITRMNYDLTFVNACVTQNAGTDP